MIEHFIKQTTILLIFLWPLSYAGCAIFSAENETPAYVEKNITDPKKAITVTKDTFVCLKKMQPVRGFFVGNILGNLDATIIAANSKNGAKYPPGSIVQLIPAEVMIKHHNGWSPKTNDWEFFELDVSEEGSKIKVRGTTQVINKFGGNCFECHQKAEPEWDMICEQDHGCDSLPVPDFLIRWTQNSDPRCD
ncbi:MAG: hypothetical protein DIZ80_01920 [endosymbiont of Galathealinum brachiosum]|uniref:Cytochrome P460 domain-containing protein n=1 Tax=endosymbiont of Galathealinum brachiosum TaxID=2200906 RepID=A0A370DN22_9GAMM|nr:MAG: hypothetical protein DIZ80_01920 [endosymbiont of Galathealinum brachiosum]